MKINEYFTTGQSVWVITGEGIIQATYKGLITDDNCGYRLVGVYKQDGGYLETHENKVFLSHQSAVNNFVNGYSDDDKKVTIAHESMYDVKDKVYYIDREKASVEFEVVTSVRWRLGQFEYHTNRGGAAVYFERMSNYYRTREEAINEYLSK